MIRVHRVPFSTNVERVALAAGIKGLALEWVDHDPGDRAALRELSGQELVPVAEFGTDVVVDSMAILARLEEQHPEPPLFPGDPRRRAAAEVFTEWFNEVWKGPPNALARAAAPTGAEAEALAVRVRGWSERFERMLAGGRYLLGDEIGIADVCAYPFLRYAVGERHPDDDDPFHAVLCRLLGPDSHPRLDRWIERVAAQPQA